MLSLENLNTMSTEDFANTLGTIFEHSPWVARTVSSARPFPSLDALHTAMVQVVQNAEPEAQLTLIRAHPDLGTRLRMSQESVSEQSGLGLDRLSPELFERFTHLNTAYRQRFGFPFIIAVRNHSLNSILAHFEARLNNTIDQERQTALREIAQIARFRLGDLIQ
jgi:2-oxo-4-hydroxy-4-carboxy-5-ureidoimidazoline decarboxylase